MSFWDEILNPGVGEARRRDAEARAHGAAVAREAQQRALEEQRRIAQQEQDRVEKDWQRGDQERQRTEEEARKIADRTTGNIATGRSAIDSAFSQFDDGYFNNVAKSYVDQQNPQIDDQFAKAKDGLTARLAGQGTLSSSIGANRMAELAEKAAGARASAANSGRDFANQLRGNVQQSRDHLYGLNTGAVDPSQISTQAMGNATSLANGATTTPPPTVGNIFADFLTPVSNAFQANQNSARPFRLGVGSSAPTTGSGSSVVSR